MHRRARTRSRRSPSRPRVSRAAPSTCRRPSPAFAGAGAAGAFSYNAAFTHFSVHGYRPHSAADNESFNSKFGYQADERNHLSLVLNVISRPDAQDPLGLTPAQFFARPNQAAPAAIQYDTRKR